MRCPCLRAATRPNSSSSHLSAAVPAKTTHGFGTLCRPPSRQTRALDGRDPRRPRTQSYSATPATTGAATIPRSGRRSRGESRRKGAVANYRYAGPRSAPVKCWFCTRSRLTANAGESRARTTCKKSPVRALLARLKAPPKASSRPRRPRTADRLYEAAPGRAAASSVTRTSERRPLPPTGEGTHPLSA